MHIKGQRGEISGEVWGTHSILTWAILHMKLYVSKGQVTEGGYFQVLFMVQWECWKIIYQNSEKFSHGWLRWGDSACYISTVDDTFAMLDV